MDNKTIKISQLDPAWTKRANPALMLFTGGHRAKVAEWFLEVQRVVYDIYKTFAAIENFLNRGEEPLFVGKNKDQIHLEPSDRVWASGYMIENAYLRIGSSLDKIAQMTRVFYEHPNHGGPLLVYPRCGKCDPEEMNQNNCTFGGVVSALHKDPRVSEVDNALFVLEKSKLLSEVKKVRNEITHKINKTIFYPGIDFDVDLEVDGNMQKTTFTLGRKYKTPEEYWELVAKAHNEIVDQLNIIGPHLFPEKKQQNDGHGNADTA